MKENNWLWKAAIAICAAAYALMRFWGLDGSCLWFDEIFGIHAAGMGWSEMLWFIAQDLIHPPLFYALLKVWIAAGGEGLFWLRLFPFLFSLAGGGAFLLICREMKLGLPETFLAFAFLAANGSLVKYSQEVRMYAPLFFFCCLSFWLFIRLLNRGSGLAALAAVNILLVYTHNFGWLVVVSEIASILLIRRDLALKAGIIYLLPFLSVIPWIWLVWKASFINSNVSQNLAWAARPGLLAMVQFLLDLLTPGYFRQSNSEYGVILLFALPVAGLLAALGGFSLSRPRNWNQEEAERIKLAALWFFVPILIAFLASWLLPFSIWGMRHLIIIFAPLALVVADLLSNIRGHRLKNGLIAGFISILLVSSGANLARGNQSYIWCGWEKLASRAAGEEKRIYVFEDLVAYHFWFASREDRGTEIVKINGAEGLKEDTAYFLPRGFREVRTAGPAEIDGPNITVAFRDKAFSEERNPIRLLKEKGYSVSIIDTFEASGEKAFLIRAMK